MNSGDHLAVRTLLNSVDVNRCERLVINVSRICHYYTGTTDIQDLLVSVKDGCISMSVVFAGGSLSPGALVCVIPGILTEGSLDFNNMKLTTIPQDRSESVDIPVPTGTYRLFAFDLESDGLPRIPMSVIADSETVSVVAGGEGG